MVKQSYVRDKRSPTPLNEAVSRVMSSNKGVDTKPELILRHALREAGFPGYRLYWNKVPGHPDICYPGKKIAIFVNGCFWHRCPKCNLPLPKTNNEFWNEKFQRNIDRDKKKIMALELEDWTVVTVWECEIKGDLKNVVRTLSDLLNSRSDPNH
ncbi:MAG: very short patch repair endonuclease [Candidatus Cloacimonetes bacterium]|nr:very short patch repair endonuclease [Candidatus Cloacimonadota bacterium]